MQLIWLGLIVVFTIVEIATLNLTSIWFVIGGLAGLICALCNGPLYLQITLFVVVSGVSLALTRPLAKKFLSADKKATNADRVLSMVGTVTEEVNNTKATGLVKIDGKVWTARSLTGEILSVGTYVRPNTIEGVKLIVEAVRKD